MLDFLRAPIQALRIRAGGFYSVAVDDRGYAVARVLATGRGGIHVRVYSNRYRERPARIARSQLFLATNPDLSQADLNATRPEERPDPGAFAIRHLPLRRASFAAWQPRFITAEPLEADDLVEVRSWRAAGNARW